MKTISLLALICAGLLTGCQSYQYRIVQPPEHAGVVGKKPQTVSYAPLEYRFAETDRRLLMQIVNPQDQPINLRGEKSYLVDPRGETHPLESRVIAPHSFVNLSLPPAPIVTYSNPTVGVGINFGSTFYSPYHPYYRYGYHNVWADELCYGPRFNYILPPDFWEWREGSVRLHLGYQQDQKEINHEFVIERGKKR